MSELKPCHCGGSDAGIERDSTIFNGQNYGDRYPKDVTTQNHGFKIRCYGCGLQTCYWHYEAEAIEAWNHRPSTSAIEAAVLHRVARELFDGDRLIRTNVVRRRILAAADRIKKGE